MKQIRILVVEDQAVVRDGIVAILALQPDVVVVGQAEDGIQAVKLVKETQPDVILLDLVMPRQDGITTIPKILEVLPDARILVLTSFADSERVFMAIKAGAIGYLLKDDTREQLMQAIHDVSKGQASLHPSIAMKVIHEINHPAELMYTADPLTPRELETLRLIARGLSNSEISAELVVHERTIAKYVSRILEKLHLANRTQAALYALDKGLTTPKKR
jgi:two-component system, NarL family, response regulator LiaR